MVKAIKENPKAPGTLRAKNTWYTAIRILRMGMIRTVLKILLVSNICLGELLNTYLLLS